MSCVITDVVITSIELTYGHRSTLKVTYLLVDKEGDVHARAERNCYGEDETELLKQVGSLETTLKDVLLTSLFEDHKKGDKEHEGTSDRKRDPDQF